MYRLHLSKREYAAQNDRCIYSGENRVCDKNPKGTAAHLFKRYGIGSPTLVFPHTKYEFISSTDPCPSRNCRRYCRLSLKIGLAEIEKEWFRLQTDSRANSLYSFILINQECWIREKFTNAV